MHFAHPETRLPESNEIHTCQASWPSLRPLGNTTGSETFVFSQALAMSLFGTFRTWLVWRAMSASGGIAEVGFPGREDRF
jgi:hypothetical protein